MITLTVNRLVVAHQETPHASDAQGKRGAEHIVRRIDDVPFPVVPLGIEQGVEAVIERLRIALPALPQQVPASLGDPAQPVLKHSELRLWHRVEVGHIPVAVRRVCGQVFVGPCRVRGVYHRTIHLYFGNVRIYGR
jgi:hypothetical protein